MSGLNAQIDAKSIPAHTHATQKSQMIKRLLLLSICLPIGLSLLPVSGAETNGQPHTIPDLQKAIESVLKETKTPGAAIVIVSRDKTEWLAGLGKADVAADRPVTADTLFRLGSISKGFVALAALQLSEAGKLKLTDTVRQWAPDIAFVNPWEATDPVRLVHLMEHTAGFEDMHLREYALNDPAMTLNGALAFGASSRVSRWPPGERMSYCSSGPAMLAAVIEKVSGLPFDAYVQTNIFNPLHLGASYADTPDVERRRAKLYRPDGVTPYPYWYFGLWPTAGLNASARDMANYLHFYLQRGSFDGTQLLTPASIGRMERGETLPAAKLGQFASYGLYNYQIPYGPFTFHGHNGATMGGIVEFAYLPDQGYGYALMINSGCYAAADRVANLIREYLRPRLTAPPLPPVVAVSDDLKRYYAGYYRFISPTMEWAQGFHQVLSGRILTVTTNGLLISSIARHKQLMLPVTDRLYRAEDTALPTLALLPDKDGHTRIQSSMETTFERIPALQYWALFAGFILVCLLVISSLVMAPIWIVRRWLGKSRNPGPLSVRFLPLASAALLAAYMGLIFLGFHGVVTGRFIDDTSLGRPGLLSLSIWLASLAFPLSAIASLYVAWRARHTPMKRAPYCFSVLVAVAMTGTAIYFGYWGLIGLRFWA